MKYLLLLTALLTSGCASNLTMPSAGDCTTDSECEAAAPVTCVDYWSANDELTPGECK